MPDFSLLKQNSAFHANSVSALTKQWIISIFAMLSAIFAGFFISNFFLVPDLNNFITALIFLIVFLFIFPVKAILVSNKIISFWCIFVQSLGLVIFFSFGHGIYLLITAWVLTLALLLRANYKAEIIRENQLHLHYKEIARKAISGAILTFSILIAIMYASPVYDSNQSITENQIRKFTAPAELILNKTLFKGFSFDMTALEFSNQLTLSKLDSQTLATIENNPATKKNILNINFEAFVLQGQKWHVSIKPNETISAVLADFINSGISSSLASISSTINIDTKIIIPLILGILILTTVNSSLALIHFIIFGFSYLLFEILIAFGVIHISIESRNKEIIIL